MMSHNDDDGDDDDDDNDDNNNEGTNYGDYVDGNDDDVHEDDDEDTDEEEEEEDKKEELWSRGRGRGIFLIHCLPSVISESNESWFLNVCRRQQGFVADGFQDWILTSSRAATYRLSVETNPTSRSRVSKAGIEPVTS